MATETKEVKKKAPAKKPAVKKVAKADEATSTASVVETSKGSSFIYALGRRKTAIAKVRLIMNGKGLITVNGRPMEEVFNTYESRMMVNSPLKMSGLEGTLDVSAETNGGGILGQAEAVRLGISRALIELNPTYRTVLKKLGFLMRDPRAKERKKPGLRKARRAPQWGKR